MQRAYGYFCYCKERVEKLNYKLQKGTATDDELLELMDLENFIKEYNSGKYKE